MSPTAAGARGVQLLEGEAAGPMYGAVGQGQSPTVEQPVMVNGYARPLDQDDAWSSSGSGKPKTRSSNGSGKPRTRNDGGSGRPRTWCVNGSGRPRTCSFDGSWRPRTWSIGGSVATKPSGFGRNVGTSNGGSGSSNLVVVGAMG